MPGLDGRCWQARDEPKDQATGARYAPPLDGSEEAGGGRRRGGRQEPREMGLPREESGGRPRPAPKEMPDYKAADESGREEDRINDDHDRPEVPGADQEQGNDKDTRDACDEREAVLSGWPEQ